MNRRHEQQTQFLPASSSKSSIILPITSSSTDLDIVKQQRKSWRIDKKVYGENKTFLSGEEGSTPSSSEPSLRAEIYQTAESEWGWPELTLRASERGEDDEGTRESCNFAAAASASKSFFFIVNSDMTRRFVDDDDDSTLDDSLQFRTHRVVFYFIFCCGGQKKKKRKCPVDDNVLQVQLAVFYTIHVAEDAAAAVNMRGPEHSEWCCVFRIKNGRKIFASKVRVEQTSFSFFFQTQLGRFERRERECEMSGRRGMRWELEGGMEKIYNFVCEASHNNSFYSSSTLPRPPSTSVRRLTVQRQRENVRKLM